MRLRCRSCRSVWGALGGFAAPEEPGGSCRVCEADPFDACDVLTPAVVDREPVAPSEPCDLWWWDEDEREAA